MNETVYTLEEWLKIIIPYPSLSYQMGQPEIINDIIKTHIPDIIHSLVLNKFMVKLVKFYCYVDDDGKVKFDFNPDIIKAYTSSIKLMTLEDISIITRRNVYRERLLDIQRPKKP